MDFNHLPLTTEDGTQLNLDALYKIAPSCFTEARDEKTGALRHVVDFKKLRQLLGDNAVEDKPEAYEFTWVGKQAARREAATPINKTLRPVPESSVDWDHTQNIYIEGDNLDALKILQKSYLGKIKVMYFDPPYNTGNDFIYKDRFKIRQSDYDLIAGNVDEEGNRYVKNLPTNATYHSDWCTMMYMRLSISHTLLKDDGVIFISIDENEVANLIKICNEVFGESNFIAQFVWQNKKGGGNDSQYVATEHEYVVSYAKDKSSLGKFYEAYNEDYAKRYKEEDEIGRFYWDTFKRKSGKQYYPITCPDGTVLQFDEDGNPISWLRSEKRFKQDIKEGEARIVPSPNGGWSVQFKQRMPQGKKPRSIFTTTERLVDDKGTTSTGSEDVYRYFKKDVFSNPKPIALIKYLLGFAANDNAIVMDIFSGSGTTADSIFRLNKDGGKRTFILVQYPENIDNMLNSSSENAKRIANNAISVLDELHKPHLLTELGEERIRRAGSEVNEEFSKEQPNLFEKSNKLKLDTGFRVFRVDSSNMKDVYFAPKDLDPQQLDLFADNVKEDRTELDLLYGCMVDWGVQLSLPLATETIDGVTVYTVNDGDLVACFGKSITDNVVKAMADKSPLRVLFRDSCFEKDEQKINIFEQFKQLLGWSDDEALNNIRVI